MTKMMDKCPKCGSNLILRDGQFGEFLACPRFPDCKYTASICGTHELYRPSNPYCEKCNRTGLLPFVKNDKVIPNVYINCECKEFTENFNPTKPYPSDFDFPQSDTFRGYSFQYCEQADPVPMKEVSESLEVVRVEGGVPYNAFDKLSAQVNYNTNKVKELQAKKKKDDDLYA